MPGERLPHGSIVASLHESFGAGLELTVHAQLHAQGVHVLHTLLLRARTARQPFLRADRTILPGIEVLSPLALRSSTGLQQRRDGGSEEGKEGICLV